MRNLGNDIHLEIARLMGDDEQARINIRARQVRGRYREALEKVYREQAQLFLDHTNNVYIMNKDGVKTLIVYVDESIFAAELNAQRELIKLKLLELFGEQIEQFEIHVSRGSYKKNHPYIVMEEDEPVQKVIPVPLTEDERKLVSDRVSEIENPLLRKSLQRAMTADIEWKKAETKKESNSGNK